MNIMNKGKQSSPFLFSKILHSSYKISHGVVIYNIGNAMWWQMAIKLIVVIILQCIQMSNHYVIHVKMNIMLYVKYTSVKFSTKCKLKMSHLFLFSLVTLVSY